MMTKKIGYIILVIFLNLILNSCSGLNSVDEMDENCIRSFIEFAYFPNIVDNQETTNDGNTLILPTSPWKFESDFPEFNNEYIVSSREIKTSRLINNQTELWIYQIFQRKDFTGTVESAFLVYEVETNEWKYTDTKIANANSIVTELYSTSDNKLWGTLYNYEINKKRIPILSKYDDLTNAFLLVSEIDISEYENKLINSGDVHIAVDDNDIFWIFINNFGIYKFDPITNITQKLLDTPDYCFFDIAISEDDIIYFEVRNENIYDDDTYLQLNDNMLFKYYIKTNNVEELPIPSDKWPLATSILLDESGKLWLGAIGYREVSGKWVLLHPDKEQYFLNAGNYYWASPKVILESSNGYIWFTKYVDNDEINGTAWYDPSTAKGCQFTNLVMGLIEDDYGNIWSATENGLYKLEP